MKINMPVTNNEVIFADDQFMLTKTDLKGIITYANHDFIKVSGFSEAELVGVSHNVVRHPDMPIEAFEDMWRALKAGKPWSGLVKNRCKNGDYYWVVANAAPIFENGQVTGYLSARRKPTRQQIDATAAAYRLFKEDKARNLQILDGEVVERTLINRLKSKLLNIKISQRLAMLVGFVSLLVVVLVSFALVELNSANKTLKNVYEARMIPVGQLGQISNLMLVNRSQIAHALRDSSIELVDKAPVLVLNPQTSANAANEIEKNIEIITGLWKQYLTGSLTPEEKKLADNYAASRGQFVKDGLRPAVAGLRANNYEDVKASADKAETLFNAAGPDLAALINFQNETALIRYEAADKHFNKISTVGAGGLVFLLALLIWFGWLIARSVTKPLSKINSIFSAISSKRLDSDIDIAGDNELSHVLQALCTMQTMLNVNLNESKELAEKTKEESAQYEGQLTAISQSTGVIEFTMDGKVIAANEIYLKVLGYGLDEVLGEQHSAFVDAEYRTSAEYKQFWAQLNRGEAVTGEFRRFGKNGKEVWIQASYNPILCVLGKPYKVVLYATDVTEQKIRNADFEGQINAIGQSQGVIELGLDGLVLKANDTYLKMLGYSNNELIGKHVSIVLDANFAKSEAYATLWNKLVQGGSETGQYKRIAKNGKEVWIQASYNPINDLNGKPFKIVNYTIDITEQKLDAANNAGQISAINKIQGVVEFDLAGKILTVNENFADLTGYPEKEIVGN
ncbi:PAS domain S-box protein, partial [Hydrogenophaga sp.]|uniref:PAS domain S-box protein n=1 Tax=Hydrogenophaga sp. TaxID=1904254 RepID=UPI0027363EA3